LSGAVVLRVVVELFHLGLDLDGGTGDGDLGGRREAERSHVVLEGRGGEGEAALLGVELVGGVGGMGGMGGVGVGGGGEGRGVVLRVAGVQVLGLRGRRRLPLMVARVGVVTGVGMMKGVRVLLEFFGGPGREKRRVVGEPRVVA
jgi:hypothetical protein